ncbi:MAG: bifunctional UDP-N-acetylglucosamine diphosphorylase/glucosamine-1-phosphate N-acetyltransferase GlmU [Rickettsiales bacterium]|jgi:bifunctional UDP-N-acetylglucosamine pyrophosphorylase/glucosamine-1-phosphate N-acetyltransferase|nr:bifunctional UDP-N-acetylglucosamine diphosphorylase/glucosamine-1-phosphate N-acetyltransferase GlmU [Rickettsiales bacterium]
MNNPVAVVLCAGRGSRMKSGRPKVLHRVAGLEIVAHVLGTLETVGVEKIVLVVSEDNREAIEAIIPENVKTAVQSVVDGTASATRVGLGALDGDTEGVVLVTYCDVPLVQGETYGRMLDALEKTGDALVLLAFNTGNRKNEYGRLVLGEDGRLGGIVEYRDASDSLRNSSLCNAGIYAVRGRKLLERLIGAVGNDNGAGEYYLTDIVEIAIRQNYPCSYVLVEEGEVQGINSRKELAAAERAFQDRMRGEFMARGVTLVDPASVFFSYDTVLGRDVTVEPNVIFARGVRVEEDVQIRAFSYLEGCEIESGSTIGPFARLRPGTSVGRNARIGNFCEIKGSTIGNGTKISHLSYIGDTEVGEDTNIGAGTITCNYDGYSKFKTRIGKNSFIGSNSVIVAPVEIGENSLTAAGSVVTESAGSNSLIIARAEQRVVAEGMLRYRAKRSGRPVDS